MCISFLYLKHFLLFISFNKYKEVPLKLENNIRNFSDLFQVVQFQESNLLNEICHLIVSCCEKMVNKVRYEKLLSLYVLGEDLALHKAQAVKNPNMLPPDENSLMHDVLQNNHQGYTWRRCTDRFVRTLPFHEFCWKIHDNMKVPVW